MLILLGAFGGFLLNFQIAKLIYPDDCIYHFQPAPENILSNTFFDYNSSTGYHPEPSLFSMIFYVMIGIISGLVIARYLNKKRKLTYKT
jgi:ABC-type antimicrobial peptide transport system permease subunit